MILLTAGLAIFDLRPRTRNALTRMGIRTVAELIERTEPDLMAVKGFGATSLFEVERALAEHGLALGRPAPQVTPVGVHPSRLDIAARLLAGIISTSNWLPGGCATKGDACKLLGVTAEQFDQDNSWVKLYAQDALEWADALIAAEQASRAKAQAEVNK